MRKVKNFLSYNKYKPQNFLQFPFDKLVTKWDSASKVFRFYVAPWGNDSFDGLSLNTPKRQIQAAIDSLPADGDNKSAYIFIAGGSYNGFNISTIDNIHLEIIPIGDWINADNGAFCTWVKNGINYTLPSTLQVVINGTPSVPCLKNAQPSKNLWIQFWQERWLSSSSISQFGIIKFSAVGDNFSPIQVSDCGAIFRHCIFDGSALTGNLPFIDCEWNSKHFEFVGGRFIGNPGQSWSSSNGMWRAFISLRSNNTVKLQFQYWIPPVWAAGFTPVSGKELEFINVRNLISDWNSLAEGYRHPLTNVNLSDPTRIFVDNSGLANALIDLTFGAGFSGSVNYHSDLFVAAITSASGYTVTDAKTSVTKQNLSSAQYIIGNSSYEKLPSLAPPDADITNSFLSFYLDEAGNKLMVKLKYSSGLVKTGSVNLL